MMLTLAPFVAATMVVAVFVTALVTSVRRAQEAGSLDAGEAAPR